jgi:hypothetical protein
MIGSNLLDYKITRMKGQLLVALALLLFTILAEIPHYTKKQIAEKIDTTKINYGSTIRIKANAFNY